MLTWFKKLSSFVSSTWTSSISWLKSTFFNSSDLVKDFPEKDKISNSDLKFTFKKKGDSVDFLIIVVKTGLTYDLYLAYMLLLEEKLDFSKIFARVTVEALCNSTQVEEACMFQLPHSYTLHGDTYPSDIETMYKAILSLSEKYTVKKISTLRLTIKLYKKTYKLEEPPTI